MNALNMNKQPFCDFIPKWKVWPCFDGIECIKFHPNQIPQHAPAHSHNDCFLVATARAHQPAFGNGHLMQAILCSVRLCSAQTGCLVCCGQHVQRNKTMTWAYATFDGLLVIFNICSIQLLTFKDLLILQCNLSLFSMTRNREEPQTCGAR